MKNKKYLDNVVALKKEIYGIDFDDIENMDVGYQSLYSLVSANILTYMPEINIENHFKILQDIQFHRSLCSLDQYFLIDNLKINDRFRVIEKSKNVGHIFVTYHTGSYRMFNKHLTINNISYCLVTEEVFIKKQGKMVQKLYNEVSKDSNKKLEILSANNPRLIFELIKRLKKGISVVFYIDGNTGSTEKKLRENKNLLKINFLNHHIYARQGIAFLAYLSKAPMAIAIAKRDKNLNNIIQINPVKTVELLQNHNRNEFINIITQKLYGKLEKFLINNYEQWEGWFYIHKFFETKISSENLISKEEVSSNKAIKFVTLVINQFIHLIKYDDNHIFLIKKDDYQIMKITNFLYNLLFFFKKPITITPNKSLLIDNKKINWNIVTELIDMNYLKKI